MVSKSWLVLHPVLLPDVSSALPDFDTSVDCYHTLSVVSALASNPMASLFLSCVYVPSVSTPLLLHIPPSGSVIEIVLIKYSGNCIIGNVIFKLK